MKACHSMASPEGQLTIPKALEISEQHQAGDIDPAVTKSLKEKLENILQWVEAQPATRVLTKEEFAVLSHNRDIFSENETVQLAIQRFLEHQRNLIDKQEPKERKDRYVKTPKTDFLQDSHNSVLPPLKYDSQSENIHPLRHNNDTQYGSKASTTTNKGRCERCIRRRARCDGERPFCGSCRRANVVACVYEGGTGDFGFKPSVFDTGIMLSKERVTPTSPDQFHNLSPLKDCDRMDKYDAADACERCGQRRTECDGEHPESPEKLSQEPHEKIHISYGAYGEQHTISSDGQANEEDDPTLQTWQVNPKHLGSLDGLNLDLSPFRVRVLDGKEYSLANSMKLWVQILTGESWDWWPLRPCFRQLLDDEVRIQWYCVSYHPLPNSKPAENAEEYRARTLDSAFQERPRSSTRSFKQSSCNTVGAFRKKGFTVVIQKSFK